MGYYVSLLFVVVVVGFMPTVSVSVWFHSQREGLGITGLWLFLLHEPFIGKYCAHIRMIGRTIQSRGNDIFFNEGNKKRRQTLHFFFPWGKNSLVQDTKREIRKPDAYVKYLSVKQPNLSHLSW